MTEIEMSADTLGFGVAGRGLCDTPRAPSQTMKDVDRRLAELAASQRQVFTRDQAVAAGLTHAGLHRRTKGGLFVPHGPRTLHFAGTELDWRGRLLAGLLDLGDSALVSGRSAAALHGLDGYVEGPIELLVPRRQREMTAVGRVSSSLVINPLDRDTVDGLRVTSATRTILDLAGRVSERELGNAIDSACRLGLSAPVALRRRLEQLGRQGRAGVASFDRVMESAGVQSWLERRFLRLLTEAGIVKPTVQRTHRKDGQHIARVDFDFEPVPVIAEVGGRRGYMSADERRRQEHRRNELQLLGKVVYFFTTEDVAEAAGYVIATIRAALAEAA